MDGTDIAVRRLRAGLKQWEIAAAMTQVREATKMRNKGNTSVAGMDTARGGSAEQDSKRVFLTTHAFLAEPVDTRRGEVKGGEPKPVNRHITKEQTRWFKGDPPPTTLKRRVRLRAPETCWVGGCYEAAWAMPYLFKYYGGSWNETLCSGVDRDCPFLCYEHHLEDGLCWKQHGYAKYTNSCGWANMVIHRPIIQDYHLFEPEDE